MKVISLSSSDALFEVWKKKSSKAVMAPTRIRMSAILNPMHTMKLALLSSRWCSSFFNINEANFLVFERFFLVVFRYFPDNSELNADSDDSYSISPEIFSSSSAEFSGVSYSFT